jgi:hypothetical protein
MGRAAQSITFLLIGAVAAASGTGYFLYRANTDRVELAAESETARAQADAAARSAQQLAEEANRKLAIASQEVAKAQERIRLLEEERDFLARAETLTRPRYVASWKEWVNVTHGFSVRLPLSAKEPDNDDRGLNTGSITIKPYDASTEPTEQTTVYAVDGHLLIGTRSSEAWVFRVQSEGKSTHTILAYPSRTMTERTLLDILSTLTFRD